MANKENTIDKMSGISNTNALLDKMKQWHNGQRRQNVKACSDEKLKVYYIICLDNGYIMETNTLYRELVERDLQDDIPEMVFKKSDVKLDPNNICKYIETHVNDIGDDDGDLFKTVERGCVYYSWGRDKRLSASEDYDCMIDKRNMIMKMCVNDNSPIDLNNTLEVINTINSELFGS